MLTHIFFIKQLSKYLLIEIIKKSSYSGKFILNTQVIVNRGFILY
jgi:hypothetical protein